MKFLSPVATVTSASVATTGVSKSVSVANGKVVAVPALPSSISAAINATILFSPVFDITIFSHPY